MAVTFVANDTRGGVEPYLTLAREAAGRGHAVQMVAPPQYARDVAADVARFVPLRGAEAAQTVASEGPISLREMSRRVSGLTARWALDAVAELDRTDVVVAGIGGMAVASALAERLGAPLLRAHLQPLDAPSSRYPGALASPLDRWGPAGRRASHVITRAGTALLTRAPARSARRALGLSGRSPAMLRSIVYGFSPAVVPVRSDPTTERIATGYWTPPGAADVDPLLRAFVDRPGPIVSVGFGSTAGGDPVELRQLVVGAVRRAGVRAVLLTGWGALDGRAPDSDEVFTASAVEHTWLFPRMTATVHHGGAGTTGAAFAAGRPTVIVPFGADQPFWAQRAHVLGVAPAPLPRRRLRASALGEAIRRACTDAGMRSRAERLGAVLGREDGARAAIDAIERAVQGAV